MTTIELLRAAATYFRLNGIFAFADACAARADYLEALLAKASVEYEGTVCLAAMRRMNNPPPVVEQPAEAAAGDRSCRCTAYRGRDTHDADCAALHAPAAPRAPESPTCICRILAPNTKGETRVDNPACPRHAPPAAPRGPETPVSICTECHGFGIYRSDNVTVECSRGCRPSMITTLASPGASTSAWPLPVCGTCGHEEWRHYYGTNCVVCKCPQFNGPACTGGPGGGK